MKHEDKGAFKFNSNENLGAGWKYGKELVFLPLNVPGPLLTSIDQGGISTFEAVSTMFECKEDMQVGIMACSCVNLLAKSLEKGLRSTEDYEAQKGDTFITVGKITHVGSDQIEYSVNTVPGFSGAPVFLLAPEEEQHMNLSQFTRATPSPLKRILDSWSPRRWRNTTLSKICVSLRRQ